VDGLASPTDPPPPRKGCLVPAVIGCLTFAALVSGAFFWFAWSSRALFFVAKGAQLASRNDFRGAERQYDRALEANPRQIEALTQRGWCRMKLHDYDGALDDYDRALAIRETARDLNNRAYCRVRKGDYAGGITDASRAVKLEPNSAALWDTLGEAKLLAGDRDGGITALTKALEIAPEYANSLRLRGGALAETDPERAIDDLEKCLSLDPAGEHAPEVRASLSKLRAKMR
jgi:tetratricopeptide (TPR) repeat protein